MAGVADSIKSGLSKKVTELNLKTNTFLEANKIKTYIGTLNDEIRNAKLQIGEITYRLWSEGNLSVDAVQALCEQIKEHEAVIREQEALILALNEQTNNVLGNKETENGTIVCPQCQAAYADNVKFCIKCGTKLR